MQNMDIVTQLQRLLLSPTSYDLFSNISEKIMSALKCNGGLICFYDSGATVHSAVIHLVFGNVEGYLKNGTPIPSEDLALNHLLQTNNLNPFKPFMISYYSMKMNSIAQLRDANINEAIIIPLVDERGILAGYFAFFYTIPEGDSEKPIIDMNTWTKISPFLSLFYRTYSFNRRVNNIEMQNRETQLLNEVLMTKVSSYIIIFTPAGLIKSVNSKFEELSEIPKEKLIGHPLPTTKDELARIEPLFLEASKGVVHNSIRVKILDKTNVPMYFNFDLIPIMKADGEILEVVFFGENVTDYVKMENMLKESESKIQNYEHEITEYKHSVESMQDEIELSKKVKAIVTMTARLKNWFNNSLQVIVNYFDTFEEHLIENPDVKGREMLLGFSQTSYKLTKNITDTLREIEEIEYYSKITKKIETTINLYKAYNKFLKAFAAKCEKFGILYHYEINFNELKTRNIHAREVDLERTVNIFGSNAILACINKNYGPNEKKKISFILDEVKKKDRLYLKITV